MNIIREQLRLLKLVIIVFILNMTSCTIRMYKLIGRSSVRYLHPDFGHFDSNIRRWIDVGGPATTSRFVDR